MYITNFTTPNYKS